MLKFSGVKYHCACNYLEMEGGQERMAVLTIFQSRWRAQGNY